MTFSANSVEQNRLQCLKLHKLPENMVENP